MTEHEMREFVKKGSPWYQGGIVLSDELVTEAAAKDREAGDCRLIWDLLDIDAERDIKGKYILDVCCNAGFYSMTCDELGARIVEGFDVTPEMIVAARNFAAWKMLTNCNFWLQDIADWDWDAQYDTVFFMQAIYHLNDPAKYLKLALKSCQGLMVLIVRETEPWTSDVLEEVFAMNCFKQEARYPDTLALGKFVVKARRI